MTWKLGVCKCVPARVSGRAGVRARARAFACAFVCAHTHMRGGSANVCVRTHTVGCLH